MYMQCIYTSVTPSYVIFIVYAIHVFSNIGTGTGKTLSFVLPILERMSGEGVSMRFERGRPPCTLVMAPTRELANQVSVCIYTCN